MVSRDAERGVVDPDKEREEERGMGGGIATSFTASRLCRHAHVHTRTKPLVSLVILLASVLFFFHTTKRVEKNVFLSASSQYFGPCDVAVHLPVAFQLFLFQRRSTLTSLEVKQERKHVATLSVQPSSRAYVCRERLSVLGKSGESRLILFFFSFLGKN